MRILVHQGIVIKSVNNIHSPSYKTGLSVHTHTHIRTHERTNTHTRARARTHARTRARTHTHTHTHTHTGAGLFDSTMQSLIGNININMNFSTKLLFNGANMLTTDVSISLPTFPQGEAGGRGQSGAPGKDGNSGPSGRVVGITVRCYAWN